MSLISRITSRARCAAPAQLLAARRRSARRIGLLGVLLALAAPAALSAQIDVTPQGGSLTASDYHSGYTATFTVTNNLLPVEGGPTEDAISLSCGYTGSVTSCSVQSTVTVARGGGTANVDVTYGTGAAGSGTVTLDAGGASGWYNVTVQAGPYLVASTDFNNNDNQSMGLCAASCFAATQALSTVPYFSLDQTRSVTLAYHGDRVALRPFVFADVSLSTGHPTASRYWLEAKVNGVQVTFLNGDTRSYFSVLGSGSTTARLAGQFDATASQYGLTATGMYPLQIKVGVDYSGGSSDSVTVSTKLMFVDERKSPVARGWTIAGVQHLYAQSDGALVTEGDGSALFFAKSGAVYTAPQGEFSTLAESGSGTGLVYTRSYPDSARAQFDYQGRLLRLVSRTLDTTTFEYDGSGRLTRIYDPFRTNGSTTHLYTALSYGTYGLSSIQEPGRFNSQTGGRTTTVTVGSDSTLTTWADPDGVSTRFAYITSDGSRRLQKVINRRGDTTTVNYDATSWKLASIVSPRDTLDPRLNGSSPAGQLRAVFRPWQTVGVPISATSVMSPATSVASDTVRAAASDTLGYASAFTVNRWGQPVITTVRPGTSVARVTKVFYNAASGVQPDSIRRHGGAMDRFAWSGPRLTSQQPAGQNAVNYYYGAFNQVDSVKGTGRARQAFYHGSRGRVDSVQVASSKARYTYDSRYRVVSVQDMGGGTTSFHYEAFFGNRDSTLAPGSRFTRVRFDGFGRDTASNANTLPWRRTLYDDLNQVVKTFHDAQGDTTTYTYGDSLHLTQVKDAKSQTYAFAYNKLGQLRKQTDPFGKSDRYYYSAQGVQTTWVNRRADTVATTYDALGRALSVSGNRVTSRSFQYDSVGRKSVASNAYSIDAVFTDTLTGWADSVVTQFATDTSKHFRVRYLPTALQQLDSVAILGTGTSIAFAGRKYVWDTTGVLKEVRLNGVSTTNGYNGAFTLSSIGLPSGVSATLSNTTTQRLYQSVYSSTAVNDALWRAFRYDSLNRVTEDYANATAPDKQRYTYGYDQLGRLTQVTDSILANACVSTDPDFGGRWCGTNPQATYQAAQAYAYDAVGNMTSVNDGVANGTPGYSGNRLTSWPGGWSYAYDDAGNMTKRKKGTDSTLFFWSADGRLDSLKAGTRTVQYDYSAGGQLVRKRVSGSVQWHWLWDQGQILAELSSDLAARVAEYAYYLGADRPLAVLKGATTITSKEYYQLDALGNVWGTIDDAGTVTNETRMEPWGFLVGGTIPSDGYRLGWKALPYEADTTQLYYVRNRWYDPRVKRFISEDPIGLNGGPNPYAFAADDPADGRDPSGLRLLCPSVMVRCAWDSIAGDGFNDSQSGGGSELEAFMNETAASLAAAANAWRQNTVGKRGLDLVCKTTSYGLSCEPVGSSRVPFPPTIIQTVTYDGHKFKNVLFTFARQVGGGNTALYDVDDFAVGPPISEPDKGGRQWQWIDGQALFRVWEAKAGRIEFVFWEVVEKYGTTLKLP